jgi:hypothetical protein
MFDLDAHIRDWRHQLLQHESVAPSEVDELESHLRDTVEELSTALEPDEAFLLATRRVGSPDVVALEFSKINGARTWTRRAQWMLAGYLVMSLGLGMIGAFSYAAMMFAAYLGMPFWIAGAFSSLGIVISIVTMMYFAWSVTNGNSLGLQKIASKFANYAKTGRKWWVVTAVLLLLIAKTGAGALSSIFFRQAFGPEQFGVVATLSSTAGWTSSLILFGSMAALLCWLVNQDGENRRLTQSKMLFAAAIVAVLIFATYGLVLAGMPYLYGSKFAIG